MVQGVRAVATADHLDFLQFAYGRGNVHVVGLLLVPRPGVAQVAVQPVADDEGYELDEYLGGGRLFGTHPQAPVAQVALVATEKLLRRVTPLVEPQGFRRGHLLGCYQYEVAAKTYFPPDNVLFLVGVEKDAVLVVYQVEVLGHHVGNLRLGVLEAFEVAVQLFQLLLQGRALAGLPFVAVEYVEVAFAGVVLVKFPSDRGAVGPVFTD